GLLVLPLSMGVVYGIRFWREALDRNRQRAEGGELSSHGKATRTLRLIISIMLLALYFVQVAAALGRHPDMSRLASAFGPFLLAIMGNFFGKLKPNRYMGIRLPWTLKSETVWRRTHRVTGWLYTIVGLIAGALALLAPSGYAAPLTTMWLAIIILVPIAVAWQAAREERTARPSTGGITLGWMAAIETVVLMGIIAIYFNHAADHPHAPQRKAAQAAAERWIVNLDEERYPAAWAATGSDFKKKVKQDSQVQALNKYRKPLGKKVSRKLYEATYYDSLPKSPKGKYVVVRFDTTFEGNKQAIETVVEVQEPDGQWQVSGYFIK
ncbi:MAG: hypothetical protein JWO08_4284, partial [Verrucomicrobiaceae bacterium]|nr:hypothetical protein [Verrucomicrobiaceae bacterium]